MFVSYNEPSTQNPRTPNDATKAVKEHVHGFVLGDGQHGLFPQLVANDFPLSQAGSQQVRNFLKPTPCRLQCRVLQLTLNVKDILLLKVLRPVCRCTFDLHLLHAHGDDHGNLQTRGLHSVLQATRCFQTSKQQRCSIRRPVNDSSIQRPRFYGLKAVVVLVCDIIQSSLPAPISISVSDIRSVLHSAARQ